jgi:hypothetical protein
MMLRVERDLGLLDILKIFADVCLLSVPLLLATHLIVRGSRGPEAEGSRGTGSAGTEQLLSSLKPERRGQLLALASEDHYVRIFTSAGSQLMHTRLVDAIAAAGEHNGCRVHRSWWVATGAVRSTSREGDRTIIELLDGTRVPVSRSYVLAARQAGLISA